MNNETMFLVATKGKFRFPYKGLISTEDLFDLSIKELDSIFKTLNSQLKQTKEESLLEVKTKQDEELETKIEIIKYIVKTKQDEEEARKQAKAIKEQKQKILELIANKQDKDLENKSMDELKAMLSELDG